MSTTASAKILLDRAASWGVVNLPVESLIVSLIWSAFSLIAVRTWEGSSLCELQADPCEKDSSGVAAISASAATPWMVKLVIPGTRGGICTIDGEALDRCHST